MFRRLWLGAFCGSVAQWMQQIAIGWLALTMTDSAAFVGIVTFSGGVPFLIVAPLGGSLIDRSDRRRLMLICQALAALLATIVALVVIAGRAQPAHLVAASFLNGSLQALLNPTQQSIVPALVARDDLTNAVGLMSAGQNLTRILGPSLAGAAIGWLGVGEAFVLQAVALVIAFVLVLGVVLPPRDPARVGAGGVFDGIRAIAARPDLRALFLHATLPTFLTFPYLGFLNVYARDILHIGAAGLGVLMAVSGAGAVTGALLTAIRGWGVGAGKVLIWTTLAYGAVLAVAVLSGSLPVMLPLLFCGSMTASFFMSGNNALVQHRIDDAIRGRVMGAYLLTLGLMPLGALPMGLLAGRVGVPWAIAGLAALSTLLVGALAISSRALREL
jgi:MFS family permease